MVNLFCLCGGDGQVVELDPPTEEPTEVDEATESQNEDTLSVEHRSLFAHFKDRWSRYGNKTALVCGINR